MTSDRPICTKTFKLNNGDSFPAVGLGTYQGRHEGKHGTSDEKAMEDFVIYALQSGYRLLDTAQFYGVEHVVGRAVRNCGIPREEITVVTKFWGYWHHDPEAALRISLEQTGLDYVDVFLMHWPWANTPLPEANKVGINESPTFVETWKLMENLVGPRCKAIGVSNFTQKTLDKLLEVAKIVPAINQIELHALNPNFKLVPYCQSKGIVVMSWSTMGGSRKGSENPIRNHELFTGIAEAHQCSTGVVSLSWAVQRGVNVIPKSSSKPRILDNIKLVTLTDKDMEAINSAHETIGKRRFADGEPPQGWSAVDFGFEDEDGNWLC